MDKKHDKNNIVSASMLTFLSNTHEIVFIKDLGLNYIGCSLEFAKLVGRNSTNEVAGKNDFDIFDHDLALRYRDDDLNMLATCESLLEYTEPLPSKDGKIRYGQTSKYVIRDENGRKIGLMGVCIDITRQYQAKLNYERELRYFFDLPPDAVFAVLFDVTSWRVVDFRCRNDKNQIVSRFDRIERFMENAANSVVDDDSVKKFFKTFNKDNVNSIFDSGKRNLTMEYLRKISKGKIIWVKENIHMLTDPVSGHLSLLIIVRDIDREKREQYALLDAAEKDSLTGLFNRAATMKKISRFLVKKNSKFGHALFMIDVDNLKCINDKFGHQCGDNALKELAKLLRSFFSEADILGRLGGDEFFVFMKNVDSVESAKQKAESFLLRLNANGATVELGLRISCSIGISLYRGDNKPLEQLYAEADTALYRAKALGKNRYFIFEEITFDDGASKLDEADYTETFHMIGERLIEEDYECIAVIDLKTEKVICCKSKNAQVFYPLRTDLNYYSQIDDFASLVILRRHLKDFLRNMSLKFAVDVLQNQNRHIFSFPISTTDGHTFYKEWQFLWFDDSFTKVILTRADSSRLAEAERDPLTGLYNRLAFFRRVRERLDSNPNIKYFLVRWDIDRFKVYNDMFGIDAGDALLKSIGHKVTEEREAMRIFGHIEADHFVSLIPSEDIKIASWNEQVLKKCVPGNKAGFKFNISVGVYNVDDTTIDVSLMCDRAYLALKTVKNNYDNKIGIYNNSLREVMLDEQSLVDDFETALASQQLDVYFQPQINYESQALIGAEALVRWKHPTRGLIPPDKFITLFEKKGFISRLDEYVWDKTCRYMRKWLDMGLAPITVSVNISRVDIYAPDLCDKLIKIIRKYKLPISSLKLEITESAYMDDAEQLIGAVKEFQAAGLAVAMDDFGAGFSSLNMLKDVPVDLLKLDVRFLAKSEQESRGGNILSSILRMARWLKLPVIAEGVENIENADYLKSLGCIYMQGYLFARPLPPDKFEEYLKGKQFEAFQPYANVNIDGMGAFWDASAQLALLFNNYVGGAAILEYCNANIEILRANDKFYNELGTTREHYLPNQQSTLSRFDNINRQRYLDMLESAKINGEAECLLESLPHVVGGQTFATHNRVQRLVVNGNSCLFYLSVFNISKLKLLPQGS